MRVCVEARSEDGREGKGSYYLRKLIQLSNRKNIITWTFLL